MLSRATAKPAVQASPQRLTRPFGRKKRFLRATQPGAFFLFVKIVFCVNNTKRRLEIRCIMSIVFSQEW